MSLLSRLAPGRRSGAWQPSVPRGYRIYAVGDVHGELDLLERMLAAIDADVAGLPPSRNVVVFLGDLIDRGPHSNGVVERLRTFADPRLRSVFIAGNHEEVLLRILAGEDDVVASWLRYGGLECALSYGAPGDLALRPAREAARIIRRIVPTDHRTFLEGFVDSFSAGDYLFVHAGIRPGVALDQQAAADLRWIRAPFLDWPGRHPAMVVHGHTICSEVEVRAGRIGIDTGAYRHGRLTAIALEGARRRFVQVERDARGGISGDTLLASAPGTADVPAVGA